MGPRTLRAVTHLDVDAAAVELALKAAARSGDNCLYPMKDALRAMATVGEVCGALREVWGVYRPQEFF